MPKKVVPLTDSKIKATLKVYKSKLTSESKDLRLSDGDGLNLIFKKNGSVRWRFDYTRPISKKRNTISVGGYPEVSLADARLKREEYRSLLAKGTDPQQHRENLLEVAQDNLKNTFRVIAEEFHSKQNLSPATVKRNEIIFRYINAAIGDMPIGDIKAKDLIKAIRDAEQRGTIDTAHRIRSKSSQVFRYAVSLGLCERDIAHDLIGTIQAKTVKHYAALVEEEDFARLLKDIDQYQGNIHTKLALKIAPHVFVRIGELRHAKWSDIDMDAKTWSYS